ncbi:hypothetical protein RDI58_004302 [Solanum bulbocastanum]|uniref:Uncharacterized protein n=1 Tax=Solanum bulbocastanum TaxID=147425 RepID=A0AAN8YLJ5_SOLBU
MTLTSSSSIYINHLSIPVVKNLSSLVPIVKEEHGNIKSCQRKHQLVVIQNLCT